ncbi:hypothetical protein T01_11328 [Trichinella spiralis]|uniref:Uncharacterized protein n=1 Tax=Trichinella spiralis TaxID=6334 RepID=A0A0V1ATB2_TRISP|nr:hypothetical protein T01_11328 [Trichinella spiralis]
MNKHQRTRTLFSGLSWRKILSRVLRACVRVVVVLVWQKKVVIISRQRPCDDWSRQNNKKPTVEKNQAPAEGAHLNNVLWIFLWKSFASLKDLDKAKK